MWYIIIGYLAFVGFSQGQIGWGIVFGIILMIMLFTPKKPDLPPDVKKPKLSFQENRDLERTVTNVAQAVKANAPNFEYIYFHRGGQQLFYTTASFKHLSEMIIPSDYSPGRSIIAVSPGGQIYCYNLGSYVISDKCRAYFAARLMQELYGKVKIYRADVNPLRGPLPLYTALFGDVDDIAGRDEVVFCFIYSKTAYEKEHGK